MKIDLNHNITSGLVILTHAFAWDATLDAGSTLRLHADFNIYARVGRDSATYITSFEESAFQHTHPVWGAMARTERRPGFNTRTPCRVRFCLRLLHDYPQVSTHALRVGCDKGEYQCLIRKSKFQHTHPVWGATSMFAFDKDGQYVSTHAPHAGCDDYHRGQLVCRLPVSTHAPRAGCDWWRWKRGLGIRVSTHAPRAGCDKDGKTRDNNLYQFQHTHTHPVRDATTPCPLVSSSVASFNTHIPCGMRLFWYGRPDIHYKKVSTHAPRAGCDKDGKTRDNNLYQFQHTHTHTHTHRAGCDRPSKS